jgi:histidine triad (HIT) family protein
MTSDCLFCKIANRDIPANIVHEDEWVLAFEDVSPQAPVHNLIIPKKHISTINDIGPDDKTLIGHMVLTAQKLAAENSLTEPGYRLVMNCNQDGGQTVFHIHLHIMGGRQLTVLG